MKLSNVDRALVTGATGHLGSRVVHALVAEGVAVRVLYRPGDTLRALEGLRVEHHPADMLDERAVAAATEGVDAVFHTAAMVAFDARVYERQMRVNVEGTRVVLGAAIRAGVARFVHTSTVNTLGVPPAGALGDEQTPDSWRKYRIGYMDSKRVSEELVREEAARGRIEAVCVLPGTMFGPGDVNWNAGSYVRTIAKAPLMFALPGGTTVAHVDDVARGHLLALARGRSGERYVLGGEPQTYRVLFGLIAAELGRPAPVATLPAGVLIRVARAADWLSAATGVRLPLSEGVALAASAALFYSSAKAVRDLGWSYRSARETIRDAVPWYRDYGSF